MVAAAGINAVAAGITDVELAAARRGILASAATAGVSPRQLGAYVFPRLFGGVRAPRMLADLLPIARNWAPDLLLHEQGEFAAPLVGAILGLPHVVHSFGSPAPAQTVSDAAEQMAPLWADHGQLLPPYAGCYLNLYLDIYPPSMHRGRPAHIPTAQPLRPVPYAGQSPELPEGFHRCHERPLIYLTFGTVQNHSKALRNAVAAVAALDVRVLVTVGPDGDPAALGPVPAHVTVERYVSQTTVLPYCDVVVSHAGSGTVLGAAGYGVPQVCIPQAADQFRNAEAVTRTGSGLTVSSDRADPRGIADAISTILNRPDYRLAAERVRAEILAMPTPTQVATHLEALASQG